MARFYVDCNEFTLSTIPVSDWLANHFKALRLRNGEAVTLFNGKGQMAQATLHLKMNGRNPLYKLQLHEITTTQPSSFPAMTLWQTVLPQDRMDYLIEKSCEIGFSCVQPMITARSNTRPQGDQTTKKQEHWQKVMISSCEQSGRNELMDIAPLQNLDQLITQSAPQNPTQLRLLLTVPQSENHTNSWLTLLKQYPNLQDIIIAVGPEGGFTPEEITSLQHIGFVGKTFGEFVLRSETAGIVAGCSLLTAMEFY